MFGKKRKFDYKKFRRKFTKKTRQKNEKDGLLNSVSSIGVIQCGVNFINIILIIHCGIIVRNSSFWSMSFSYLFVVSSINIFISSTGSFVFTKIFLFDKSPLRSILWM